jgi:hypothetical protein
VSNWGQTASHTHGMRGAREPRARVQGALARAPRAQGCRGHSRVPVRARKGALASGALARVPVRARTHRCDLTCASGSSDSVVQIEASIVFLIFHHEKTRKTYEPAVHFSATTMVVVLKCTLGFYGTGTQSYQINKDGVKRYAECTNLIRPCLNLIRVSTNLVRDRIKRATRSYTHRSGDK